MNSIMTGSGCASLPGRRRRTKIKVYDITPTLKLLDLAVPLPGFKQFIGVYLFRGEKTAVIDVGPKSAIPNLFSALAELDISPREVDYIILTHVHIDHAGGTGLAIKEMSNARVLAHSRARSHLIDPTILWEASLKTLGDVAIRYGSIDPVPEDKIIVATDEMRIELGKALTLEVYLTPGHATHHLSLFDRANGVLIAGEAAGVCTDGAVRPGTPPPFKLADAFASVDRLIALEPQKLCYAHFGCYDDGLNRLKRYRDQLSLWSGTIGSATDAGKSVAEIVQLLREQDSNLAYLDRLGREEYAGEMELLGSHIQGLAASVRKS